MLKLPDSELDVMLALWNATEPVPRAYFDKKLQHHNWNANTVNTLLSRLQDKGFVSCERKGRDNYYIALIQKGKYLSFEGNTILHKLFNSSIKDFMLSISQSDAMTDAEIGELQDYLERLKGGEKDD